MSAGGACTPPLRFLLKCSIYMCNQQYIYIIISLDAEFDEDSDSELKLEVELGAHPELVFE